MYHIECKIYINKILLFDCDSNWKWLIIVLVIEMAILIINVLVYERLIRLKLDKRTLQVRFTRLTIRSCGELVTIVIKRIYIEYGPHKYLYKCPFLHPLTHLLTKWILLVTNMHSMKCSLLLFPFFLFSEWK